MKKLISLLVGSILFLGVGFAQSTEETINELCAASSQVIEFWHGFRGGAPRETLENLTLEYNRMNEGSVCVRTVGQGGYRDLSTKILAAAAANELPALAQGFENNIATYLDAGVIADLGALGVNSSGLYSNFLEAVTWDGVLYGMPFNKSVHVLVYNRDLILDNADALAALGIEENADGVRVPVTLEQFVAANTLLTEVTGNPTYWFRPGDLATYEDWFWTLGGSYYDADGNLSLNSEIGVEALQMLIDWTYEAGVARAITEGFINENFGTGTFGFATDTSASYPYYLGNAEFDVGLSTMPGVSGIGSSVFQGTNLLVFNTAPEADQAAAADYINFLISPEINAVFASATGYAPLGETAANLPEFTAYLDETPDFYAIIDQLPTAQFEPNVAAWEQIRFDILGQAITKAVLQEATAQEALDEAQAAAEALMSGETR